jgi:hypothetical protein
LRCVQVTEKPLPSNGVEPTAEGEAFTSVNVLPSDAAAPKAWN